MIRRDSLYHIFSRLEGLCFLLFGLIRMARTTQGTVAAIAATGGSSFLLTPPLTPDDTGYKSQQDKRDHDRTKIIHDPRDHFDIAFSLRSFEVSLSASLYFLMNSI